MNYHLNPSDDLNLMVLVTTPSSGLLWQQFAFNAWRRAWRHQLPNRTISRPMTAAKTRRRWQPRSPHRCVSTREGLKDSLARLAAACETAPSLSNMLQPNNNLDFVIIIPTHRLARFPSNAETEAS